jgi:hypothetical protein
MQERKKPLVRDSEPGQGSQPCARLPSQGPRNQASACLSLKLFRGDTPPGALKGRGTLSAWGPSMVPDWAGKNCAKKPLVQLGAWARGKLGGGDTRASITTAKNGSKIRAKIANAALAACPRPERQHGGYREPSAGFQRSGIVGAAGVSAECVKKSNEWLAALKWLFRSARAASDIHDCAIASISTFSRWSERIRPSRSTQPRSVDISLARSSDAISYKRRIEENQVQAGISYKFDLLAPPPVVAKY